MDGFNGESAHILGEKLILTLHAIPIQEFPVNVASSGNKKAIWYWMLAQSKNINLITESTRITIHIWMVNIRYPRGEFLIPMYKYAYHIFSLYLCSRSKIQWFFFAHKSLILTHSYIITRLYVRWCHTRRD